MTAGVLTVQDVITRVQRTFGDESSAQVTTDDIIRWINDAQREAVMQCEDLLQKIGYISTVSGQKDYSLPADLFTLKHVYVKDAGSAGYYILKWLPLVEMSEQIDGWDTTDAISSYPLVFNQQEDGKLTIFPPPMSSVANGIKLNYSRYATDVVDTNSAIDLPPYLHSYVVNFCEMQAYEMDEDWESASNKANQIQGDLDFNNNRKDWFGKETYPTISPTWQDQDEG